MVEVVVEAVDVGLLVITSWPNYLTTWLTTEAETKPITPST